MTAESFQPSPDDKRYDKTYGIEERTATEIKLVAPRDDGPVQLQVRTEGAIIRDFRIGEKRILSSTDTADPETGDDFLQPVKTDATITMLPAGGNEVGPQHGASRYLDYTIESSVANAVELRAQDSLRELEHVKKFAIQPDGLTITDKVLNTGDNEMGISVGEHFYFAAPEADLSGIKLLDETGVEQSITVRKLDGTDETGPFSAFLPELNKGRAVYFGGFSGSQIISIPGLGEIALSADAIAEGKQQSVGLLIWHRPGSNSICFEPVSGFSIDTDGKTKNGGIQLDSGALAKLSSRVSLRSKRP
jgi:galactose mutarotase-like enzyme